jgi:hypothetical protein
MNDNNYLDLLSDSKKEQVAKVVAEYEGRLASIKCLDKKVGKWLDEFEMPFLMEFLSGSTDEFDTYFSKVNLPKEERGQICESIIDHVATCPHCELKLKYNVELDEIIHGTSHEFATVGGAG